MNKKEFILKKTVNIIFYLDIILITILTIFTNNDYNILNNRNIINNEKTLNKYRDNKFVTLDLDNSTESRFSITNNNKKISTIYTVKYGDETVLLELSNSSIITNKVNMLLKKDNEYTLSLKDDIINESEKDINFKTGYYTNVSLKENEDIVKYKYYISLALIIISSLLVLINLVSVFNNKKIKKENI